MAAVDPVDLLFNPRYVAHGDIVMSHMDLSMNNGRLRLNTDVRQDCVSIFYDKETGGALLLYHAQDDTPCGVVDGFYTLPAGATFRDLIRTFCGADCEIGFTATWKGPHMDGTELLAMPMSALGPVEVKREIRCHVTKTTPLRPTRGQMVGGVFVN